MEHRTIERHTYPLHHSCFVWPPLIVTLFCLPSAGHAIEWHVDGKVNNCVTFFSEVLVLTFQNITEQIDGYVYWDGNNLFERKTQVRFEVALKTLVTMIRPPGYLIEMVAPLMLFRRGTM